MSYIRVELDSFATVQDVMTKCMQSHEHQYIFEPVCASVLLRRNTSKEPLRPRNSPRIESQVQLEPTSLRMSQVWIANVPATESTCTLSAPVGDLKWNLLYFLTTDMNSVEAAIQLV